MSTASKNPRFTLTRPLCPQCVKLQEEIKRLREEKDRLKAQSRYQQRQIDEGYARRVILVLPRLLPKSHSRPTLKPSATTVVVALDIAVMAAPALIRVKPMQ